MPAVKTAKPCRINLRASASQERLLRNCARLKGVTMTDFIVESACEAAERILADQSHFQLTSDQLAAFNQALERPPQIHSRLRRLFAQPSVLDAHEH